MNHSAPKRARFGPVEIDYDEEVPEPRPWTLAQSAWAAELADGGPMLELGCGAGQIGLAAAALSGAPVIQVDREPAACRWASWNARQNHLDDRITVRCGSPEQVVRAEERFRLIIAGGRDGLFSTRSFLVHAAGHLEPDGAVILQARGEAQVQDISSWLAGEDGPPFTVTAVRRYGEDGALALLTRAAATGATVTRGRREPGGSAR